VREVETEFEKEAREEGWNGLRWRSAMLLKLPKTAHWKYPIKIR
jgi:hypothetical protein